MSKFNEGDIVVAIADAVGYSEIVRGVSYTVDFALDSYIALEGVRGFYQSSIFVLDDQPELYSDLDETMELNLSDAVEDAFDTVDYLFDGIEECIVDGIKNDFDRGYLAALKDVLEDCFSHRPEVLVHFVEVERH